MQTSAQKRSNCAGRVVIAMPMAVLTAIGAAEMPKDAPRDYLAVVKAYADTMIEKGRDTYGTVQSPLFATALDRKTHRIFDTTPPSIAGIRAQDRSWKGANPMHDENLYQVLYALTDLTGDKRCATESDKTLLWFLENCQSKQTGLLAWGEHCHWGVVEEKALLETHEFYRPWVLWDRCYGLNEQACLRFARGLWDHQIADKQTGNFSRHAAYDRHGPGGGNQFPRHGGYYIATWVEAYVRSKDAEYLKAVEVLVDLFERHRDPATKIIRAGSAKAYFWVPNNLSLAINLWDGAARASAALAEKMRKSASDTDASVLALPHDLSKGGKGYAISTTFPTFDKGLGYTKTWASAYGVSSDAGFAVQLLIRYRQNKDDAFRKLALRAADRYLVTNPQTTDTIYPGALGDIIWLLLDAHALTGDRIYLARADEVAELAMKTVMGDVSPLPKALSRASHYEAVTRGDTLMMALLRLWAVKAGKADGLKVMFTDIGV
jgi:hypothetical protein